MTPAPDLIALRDILRTPGLCGWDLETTVTDSHLEREVCTIQATHEDGREVLVHVWPRGDEAMRFVTDGCRATLISWNSTFEMTCMGKAGVTDVPVDCAMIAARVLFGTMEGDKGKRTSWALKEWSRRLLNKDRDKTIRDRDWREPLDAEAIEYGLEDTRDALAIWRDHLLPRFQTDPEAWRGYRTIADSLPATVEAHLHGLPFDPEAHAELILSLDMDLTEATAELDAACAFSEAAGIPRIVNHGSPKQVTAWMRRVMLQGCPPEQVNSDAAFSMIYQRATGEHWPLTTTGAMSLDRGAVETRLKSLTKVAPDVAAYLLKRLKWSKIVKLEQAFGEALLRHVDPDGHIRASFRPHGAQTSRTSACLTGDASVLTRERGWVRMDTVQQGEHVWTHKERWNPVLGAWSQGYRETVTVTFCNGNTLTSTKSHLLYSADTGWMAVGDERIRDVSLKVVDPPCAKHSGGSGSVSAARQSHMQAGCGPAGDDRTERAVCPDSSHAGSGEKTAGSCPVCGYKARRTEPDVREDGGIPSQLGWGVRGSEGIPDGSGGWETGVRASAGHGTDDRYSCVAASCGLACASHQFGHTGQSARESCSDDSDSTRQFARHNAEGSYGKGPWHESCGRAPTSADGIEAQAQSGHQAVCKVRSVVDGGVREVFDLWVKEDNSYASGCVFSHNSQPNIQQIPSDERFRRLFKAKAGRKLILADYSQIELRVGGLIANDRAMIEVYIRREDVHQATATAIKRILTGDPDSVATKAERKAAKAPNFACIAAGELVLTDAGLIPIEAVQLRHRVWDGQEWVNHAGVAFQGYRPVIDVQGLRGTADHEVYLEDGRKVRLDSVGEGRIARTGTGGDAIRFADRDGDGNTARLGRVSPCGDNLPGLRRSQDALCGQPDIREGHSLPLHGERPDLRPATASPARSEGAATHAAVVCHETAVREPEGTKLGKLRSTGNQGAVQGQEALHGLGSDQPPASDISGRGTGSGGQQRALCGRQPAAGLRSGELEQYPPKCADSLSRNHDACDARLAYAEGRVSDFQPVNESSLSASGRGHSPHGPAECVGQIEAVYDLLNCGPRHRFTVSGVLVSNCLYGAQAATIAVNSGVPLAEAERLLDAWLAVYPGIARYRETAFPDARAAGGVRLISGQFIRLATDTRSAQVVNCLSDDTEILTSDGWKTVDDLRVGEGAATVDPKTGRMEFHPIERITQDFMFDAKMHQIEMDAISAISTPEHRWLVYNKAQPGTPGVFKTSEELSGRGDHRIWTSSDGVASEETIWADDEVRLIGWVLTDSYYIRAYNKERIKEYGTRAGVTQSKPQNLQQTGELFQRPGTHSYSVSRRGQHVWGISHPAATRIREMMPEKTLTPEVLHSMSRRQLYILLETMLLGDGCYDVTRGRHATFCAGTKERADSFLMLCAMAGVPARASVRPAASSARPCDSLRGQVIHSKECWIVRISRRTRAQPHFGASWIKWTGRVWCPTLKHGTWIAKRNGKVFVTGNCPVQGSSASVMYLAKTLAHRRIVQAREWGADIWYCADIHDEIILDAAEADAPLACEILQEAMRDAFLMLFPEGEVFGRDAVAEAIAGDSWADKE